MCLVYVVLNLIQRPLLKHVSKYNLIIERLANPQGLLPMTYDRVANKPIQNCGKPKKYTIDFVPALHKSWINLVINNNVMAA